MSLLYHYKLNDNLNNSVVVDSEGSNDGTLVNDQNNYTSEQYNASGKINGCFDFDGINDYVNIGLSNFSAAAGSIAVWAKTNIDEPWTNMKIVSRASGGADGDIAIWIDGASNIVGGFIQNGATTYDAYSNSALADTNWHHYVFVWDGSQVAFYVDGVKQTDTDEGTSLPVQADNKDFAIANIAGDNSIMEIWDGSIDDARIFDHKLTQDEIDFLYNSGNGTENTISIPKEAILSDTLYLSDEASQYIPQQPNELSDSIYFSDEITLSLSLESVELKDTLYLNPSTERTATPVSNATDIVYYNNKLYISIDEPTGKVVEVDNLTGDPNFTQYAFDQSGEIAKNCKAIAVNTSSGHVYIGCIDGQLMKLDITNLDSREQIDLDSNNTIENLSTYDVWNYTYAGTDKATGEIIVLDESIINTINTDFRFNQLFTKKINTQLNTIFAKSFTAKLNVYEIQSKTINTDLRYLTEAIPVPEYDEDGELILPTDTPITAIKREDFHVYIESSEVTDVKLDSIRVERIEGDYSVCSFTLARKHDVPGTVYGDLEIKIEDRTIFEGTVSNVNYLSEERIEVEGRSTYTSRGLGNYKYLPYQTAGEKLKLYDIINYNVNEKKLRITGDNPECYRGIQVFMGVKTKEYGTKINSLDRARESIADGITFGNFQPKPNWTYFWWVSASNFLTNDSFTNKYIGTSPSGVSSGVWYLTGAFYWRRSPIITNEFIWVYGNWYKIEEETLTHYKTENYTISKEEPSPVLLGSVEGWYRKGNYPYKTVSASNGAEVPIGKWEDKEDGLYYVREEGHNMYRYAKDVADAEYNKLKNIGGSVSNVETNATIDLTIDGYLYYNIDVNNRIQIENISNSYLGFPVGVKGLVIDSGSMKATLTCDNLPTQSQLKYRDETIPDESDDKYKIPGKEKKIATKFDVASLTEVEAFELDEYI